MSNEMSNVKFQMSKNLEIGHLKIGNFIRN